MLADDERRRHPIANPDRAGEHPDVRDLLSGRSAFHLEDRAGHRIGAAISVVRPRRRRRRRPAAVRLRPSISSSTPAPVMADPKNTGCTRALFVCAASSARNRSYDIVDSSSTYARRNASSSARRSISAARNDGSSDPYGTNRAPRSPASPTRPIGTNRPASFSAMPAPCARRWPRDGRSCSRR